MAEDTLFNLRKESIYQVFPRCYSNEGTLAKVEQNLDRIAGMGFTVLYFLPLHEPGILNRKGKDGSPYSIRDYFAIDPAYGTMADFERLVAAAHAKGLKIMTDIVINHTACDALWCKTNPEYYWLDAEGNPTRKVPDWTDIYDLDYSKPALQDKLVEMMCFWAKKGVDAFRCDVAPIVPLAFWKRVRAELKKINPSFFLLAESAEEAFVEILREKNIPVSTDNELYEAFDVCYCYDLLDYFQRAFKQEAPLSEFARAVNYQQSILPLNAVKCWYLENHDQERIFSVLKDRSRVMNWTAFVLLAKGMGFVYAGQEAFEDHKPSLFDKEPITWKHRSRQFESLIAFCNRLKKTMFQDDSYVNFKMIANDTALAFTQYNNEAQWFGFFDVDARRASVKTEVPDGTYENLIDHTSVVVVGGTVVVDRPILVRTR